MTEARTEPKEMTCTRHGTPTRLTCAECNTPICPQCLVKTPVGLKCPEHAEATPLPSIKIKGNRGNYIAAVIGIAAVMGGLVALLGVLGGSETEDTADQGGPAVAAPDPGRIQTPQVAVMAADGGDKKILTNRRLAFDGAPAWSPDGTKIAFESVVDGKRSIWVMQSNGESIRRLTEGTGTDSAPAWSPDSTRIAFMSDRDGQSEVYVMNADGTAVRRLTNQPGQDGYPAWTPDGSRLAFVSDREAGYRVWTMASADGSGAARLFDVAAVPERPSYSRDGRRMAFTSDRDGNPEVYVANVDGTGLQRLTSNEAADGEAAFSPDGTVIVFASQRDTVPAVFVMAADGTGVRKLTTGPRGFSPAWSPDGRQIVYVSDPG